MHLYAVYLPFNRTSGMTCILAPSHFPSNTSKQAALLSYIASMSTGLLCEIHIIYNGQQFGCYLYVQMCKLRVYTNLINNG